MCRPAKCSKCGKTTWAGCGQHVDAVKRMVPADQWCGHEPEPKQPGLIGRLFGH